MIIPRQLAILVNENGIFQEGVVDSIGITMLFTLRIESVLLWSYDSV